ncbi:MAG TPA: hypothetical protein VEB87_03170 [Nitrososphaerales archaeon]|nr:hypothetical protein [Nitrososphaerales archaeon]
MSSTQEPTKQEEWDAAAKSLEQAYKQSHPNGPYPPVEIKSKPEQLQ